MSEPIFKTWKSFKLFLIVFISAIVLSLIIFRKPLQKMWEKEKHRQWLKVSSFVKSKKFTPHVPVEYHLYNPKEKEDRENQRKKDRRREAAKIEKKPPEKRTKRDEKILDQAEADRLKDMV